MSQLVRGELVIQWFLAYNLWFSFTSSISGSVWTSRCREDTKPIYQRSLSLWFGSPLEVDFKIFDICLGKGKQGSVPRAISETLWWVTARSFVQIAVLHINDCFWSCWYANIGCRMNFAYTNSTVLYVIHGFWSRQLFWWLPRCCPNLSKMVRNCCMVSASSISRSFTVLKLSKRPTLIVLQSCKEQTSLCPNANHSLNGKVVLLDKKLSKNGIHWRMPVVIPGSWSTFLMNQ